MSEYYMAALRKLETSNSKQLRSDILLGVALPGDEAVADILGHKVNKKWTK